MTCKDVYLLARAHLPGIEVISGWLGNTTEVPMDVEERVMPLLGGMILELKELAAAYALNKQIDYADWAMFLPKSINDSLPLPDRFLTACAYYLASRLLLAREPQLAQVLQNFYLDSVAAIRSEIPASIDEIRDGYGTRSVFCGFENHRLQENCCRN